MKQCVIFVTVKSTTATTLTTTTMTTANDKPAKRTQGMNWITKKKRLAIYLRDGMACAYCGIGVEDGCQLTLDHLTPYSMGGTNEASNLVTCCSKCNSSRGNRSWTSFATATANYINHGTTGSDIQRFIKKQVKKELPLSQAQELLDSRGSWSAIFSR